MTHPTRAAKVALVGAGYWGKNIARSLSTIGVLGAVVDENPEQAAAIASANGSTARRWPDVLADPDITAVAISTPAATHVQVASEALRAGKDVFVEKPMALLPERAEELARLAEEEGRVLMVGHLLQYHPAFMRLRELIADGRLGRLQYVYSNRLNFGKIRREEDVLWSFAPHDISMILSLAGEYPSEVRAEGHFALHGRIADVTMTHLAFPSGLAAHVFVSWLHPFKEQKLIVVGDRAMAVFDDREPLDRKLALFEAEVQWSDGVPIAPKVEPTYVELAEIEPLVNEMSHFVDCTRTRSTPRTDAKEGLRVLRVLAEAASQLKSTATDSQPTPTQPATIERPAGAHETAVIDPGATIGERTKIWHFSHVLGSTSIGSDCSLGQNVVAGPNVTIGDGVRIQNNVSIYEGVTLEDGVFCGPSMVFTNVTTPRAFVSRKDEFAPTLVRQGASIGANATIVCGTTIGRYAFVAAGAVVTRDVPDFALVKGVPARHAGWVSREGEILGDDLICPRTGERYQLRGGALVEYADQPAEVKAT